MNDMKSLFVVVIFILGGLGVAYDAMFKEPPQIKAVTEATTKKQLSNETVPDVNLRTVTGEDITPSQFLGKTVLINFWASWCAPCMEEFPHFVKLAQAFPDDVVIIAITKDKRAPAFNTARGRLKAKGVNILQKNMYHVQDLKQTISEDIFQVMRVPETIIVSPEGKMLYKIVGGTDMWSKEEFYKDLKKSFN